MTFNRSYFKNSIFIVIFISFLIAVFAPLEFYITNKDYFFFSGTELLPFSVLLFLALMCSGVVVLLLFSFFDMRISVPLICTFMGIVLALYVIGNYIVIDYGAMDGRLPIWEQHKKEGNIQVLIFVAIPVISLVLSLLLRNKEKILKIYNIIAIWLTSALALSLIFLLITNGLKKDPEYVATTAGEFDLSSEGNVIVLILDTYDSGAFREILKADYSDLSTILEDFTYYPDTASMYSATDLAVPHILSGVVYKNDMEFGDYIKYAYSHSEILDYLHQNQYLINLYTTCRMPQNESAEQFENVELVERTVSSHRKLAEYMYKFLGFRYLPQPFKKYFWFYPDEMKVDLEYVNDESVNIYHDNNFLFADAIESMTVSDKSKSFFLYHLDGTHPPFSINEDFTPSGGVTSIEAEARGIMVLVDRLLNTMKEKGIYDNSSIVILADHGFLEKRSNPLFLMKGINEKHEFYQSERPLSYEFLQSTLINLCEGKSAEDSVKEDESDHSIRHYYQFWDVDIKDSDYASTITEYKIPGHVWDTEQYDELESYDAPE